jgi:hypothetical protein
MSKTKSEVKDTKFAWDYWYDSQCFKRDYWYDEQQG